MRSIRCDVKMEPASRTVANTPGARGASDPRSVPADWFGRVLVTAVLSLMYLAGVARADDADERFLDGLRQRQLFRLAESFCRQELAAEGLTTRREGALTVELSRTLAERALASPLTEADSAWNAAQQVAGEFVEAQPEHPYRVLVRTQGALVLLARGESLRQLADVAADAESLREQARGHLRGAIRELAAVGEDLAERQRAQPAARQDRVAFSRQELLSLANQAQFQLARAHRNRGQCYPPDSPDRANALTQAAGLLKSLVQLEAVDAFGWQCRLEEIVCLRMARDYDTAEARLSALDAAELPPQFGMRAAAERARMALDRGDVDGAISAIEAGAAISGPTEPELSFARLETVVAAWRAAAETKDREQTRHWEKQAAAAVEHIERRHGGYWRRRAESLLSATIATSADTSSLAVLVRAAEGFYRGGQVEEALSAYDRARAAALDEDRPDEAFRLGYAAATIEHERGGHRGAVDRYRALALSAPGHPQAAEAHLLAVYNASQLSRVAQEDERAVLEEYAALLDEHLRTWPERESAGEARWLLGRLHEHQRDWPASAAAYRGIPAGHRRFAAAVEAVVRCCDAELQVLREAGRPAEPVAREAAVWLEGIVFSPEGRPPEQWTAEQRAAVLAASRLFILETVDGAGRADALLAAALDQPRDAPPEWLARAAALRVQALAASGQTAAARAALEKVAGADPAIVQELLLGLARLSTRVAPADRERIAELEVAVAALLGEDAGTQDAAGHKELALVRARALSASGRSAEAARALAALAEQFPDDGPIQEEYAQALLDAGDRASLEEALAQWRQVEQRSRPGQARWLRARYGMASTYERLGQRKAAATLIRQSAKLYPKLGGADLKERFDELLRRCEE